jgi:hypothetical protein
LGIFTDKGAGDRVSQAPSVRYAQDEGGFALQQLGHEVNIVPRGVMENDIELIN